MDFLSNNIWFVYVCGLLFFFVIGYINCYCGNWDLSLIRVYFRLIEEIGSCSLEFVIELEESYWVVNEGFDLV